MAAARDSIRAKPIVPAVGALRCRRCFHRPKALAVLAKVRHVGTPRIKVMRRTENGHISAASNDALDFAKGDFVALLDHDDELAPTALVFRGAGFEQKPGFATALQRRGQARCAESTFRAVFKSDWNPSFFWRKISSRTSAFTEPTWSVASVVFASALKARRIMIWRCVA